MFDYLIEKINKAQFSDNPFKHITVENFFNEDDFKKIVADEQIKRPFHKNHEELIKDLEQHGYVPQPFPGCITSVQKYLAFLNNPEEKFNRNLIDGYGKNIIEGYGLTMRLKEIKSAFLNDLITFLNDKPFQKCLTDKFGVVNSHYIETAYQKNLQGYEISPHADTRKKALTYMVNIYTEDTAEEMSIHTHLMKFKPKYNYLYDFWRNNPEVDTCWVPWDWCETIKETNRNNSITIFKPSNDTLHAVKLNYDHLVQQRNQIYGNLWYDVSPSKYGSSFNDVDLVKVHESNKLNSGFVNKARRKVGKIIMGN